MYKKADARKDINRTRDEFWTKQEVNLLLMLLLFFFVMLEFTKHLGRGRTHKSSLGITKHHK